MDLWDKVYYVFNIIMDINFMAHYVRTSSVVLVGKDGNVTFTERTITQPQPGAGDLPTQHNWTTKSFNFNLTTQRKI